MNNVRTLAARRPFFEVTGLRFRIWPVLLAGALMQGLLVPAREAARWLYKHNPDVFQGQVWAFVGVAMLFQALGGLAGILVMRRVLPGADAHLNWPPGRSQVALAAALGTAMGLVMLVADYWPSLAAGAAPDGGYDLTPTGIPGWLFVMITTGLCEETIFRGLLVGMLVVLIPGRVRAGRVELPVAGVIVAVLFGLAHYRTFIVDPLYQAVAQQTYAFVWGLVYVWLMERSKSLLAPVVAHGVGNFTEVGIVMILMAAWA